jgi:3-deoxy-D-manno-octulosonate 8-phosphate phosphatase (KDO 8-P phosphatase)
MQQLTVAQRAARIKLLALDIDGVLTEGSVIWTNQGHEIKCFNVRDGLGIKLFQRSGFIVAMISGRNSEVNRKRASELAIDQIYEGILKKRPALEEVIKNNNIDPSEVAFMGDDVIDLPALQIAGLAAAPANAVREVKDMAHWISRHDGGHGAVRELIELILKAKGIWDKAIRVYFN